MKYLPLTQGASALVDDQDYDRLTAIGNWCLSNRGYAVHYTKINGVRKVLYMHRIILSAPPHLQVDHINRDRLDNQRENLRFATRSQNQANKGIPINNTSNYKGVSWNRGRWEARIRVEHLRYNLGRFDDPLEAARLYDAASRYFNVEFAGVNFPEDITSPELALILKARLDSIVPVPV